MTILNTEPLPNRNGQRVFFEHAGMRYAATTVDADLGFGQGHVTTTVVYGLRSVEQPYKAPGRTDTLAVIEEFIAQR